MEKEFDIKRFFALLFISGLGFVIFGIISWVINPERETDKMNKIVEECKAAAMNQDFVTAHEKINILKNGKNKEKYQDAFDFVFNAEAIYLCAKGDEESLNRIIFLLSSIPMEGVPISEGTQYDGIVTSIDYKEEENHQLYIDCVKKFNQKCNTLIDISIAYHKYALANNVIPLYKSEPSPVMKLEKDIKVSEKTGETVGVIHTMTYLNSDKEKAIIKINKAIDDGVFPNETKHIK